jgi:DNA invertase Pin-like site-specific DNA recombinase
MKNVTEQAAGIPAALYARKSADEDLSPSSDTGNQVREIREWAPAHGFTIVEEYIDEEMKGWTMDRPGIRAIQAAIREKPCKIQALIVSAWDRLSRDIGDAFLLTGELEAYGLRLISVRQGEATDENAKLGRDLYFLISKRENLTRAGHVLAGQKRWASEGYSPGGTPPYGYRRAHAKDAKGVERVRYEIDPEKAAVVRDIYTWYAAGVPSPGIAEKLNAAGIQTPVKGVWNSQRVLRVLFGRTHQDKYSGAMIFNRRRNNKRYRRSLPNPPEEWIICDDAHAPIVTPELVAAVKDVRLKRGRGGRKEKTKRG